MKKNLRLALLLVSWTVLLTSCEHSELLEPPRTLLGPQLVLDSSFGSAGEVTSDFGGYEEVRALALQEDGKLVTVGSSRREGSSDDFVLARYMPSGSLDESFGNGGRILIPTGAVETAPNDGWLNAVELQADGKILAVGSEVLGTETDSVGKVVLARYTLDGSPDMSFGEAGFVRVGSETISDVAALALQPDGKIVVAGASHLNDERRLVRFTQSGQLDPTFGSGGIISLANTDVYTNLRLLQVEAGDFIVALEFRLVRLSADGVLDKTFGQAGEVDTDHIIQALAQQEDGSIVVAQASEPGYGGLSVQVSEPAPTDFRLTRYTAEGELDPSFGEAGVILTDINRYDTVAGLALQSDGKIVAAGTTGADLSAVAVVRYTAQGEVDTSFVGAFEGAYALALDDQNRIVVGGYRLTGNGYDFALARLLP